MSQKRCIRMAAVVRARDIALFSESLEACLFEQSPRKRLQIQFIPELTFN